jgi:hypothetical protein
MNTQAPPGRRLAFKDRIDRKTLTAQRERARRLLRAVCPRAAHQCVGGLVPAARSARREIPAFPRERMRPATGTDTR